MTILQNINDYRLQYQSKLILYTNYLLILYAFFLPINDTITRSLFTIILILFILVGDIKNKIVFAMKNKVVQAFVLFYLMYLFWMIGSETLDVAIFKLKTYRYILYIMIYITIIRDDFVYKIFSGFILGILFSEIISYLMLFGITVPYLQYSGGGLNVPFMISYTQYSIVLSISLGILLYGIITLKQHFAIKLLYILFFISASTNIFIIQSKLGYGLYSLSIMTVTALIIIKHKRYWMIPLALTLIVGGYTLAYNYSSIFHQRVGVFFNETNQAIENKNYHTSTGTRVGFNKYGYELVLQNPFFGLGTGDHISGFMSYVKKVEPNRENYLSMQKNLESGGAGSLHSEFLDNSLQFGFMGFFIFLNIFYQLLRYKVDDYYMKTVQVIFVVILLTVSSVGGIFTVIKIGKIFTLLSALTLRLYYNKKEITQ